MGAHGAWQIGGYLLWRGGLLLAGIGTLTWAWRWLVSYWLLPAQVSLGIALILTGFSLVIASLILENRADEAAA